MNRIRKSLKQLQQQCNAFNDRVPVGSAVVVTRDSGETYNAVTESVAQVLGDHSAVVWVQGGRGCVLLDRVKPAGARS